MKLNLTKLRNTYLPCSKVLLCMRQAMPANLAKQI